MKLNVDKIYKMLFNLHVCSLDTDNEGRGVDQSGAVAEETSGSICIQGQSDAHRQQMCRGILARKPQEQGS